MLIQLDHVEKQYSGFHLDCTLQVPEGRITALIGPNGAGIGKVRPLKRCSG